MRRYIIRMLRGVVIINRRRIREHCLENLFFHAIDTRRGMISLAADVMSALLFPVAPFPADVLLVQEITFSRSFDWNDLSFAFSFHLFDESRFCLFNALTAGHR